MRQAPLAAEPDLPRGAPVLRARDAGAGPLSADEDLLPARPLLREDGLLYQQLVAILRGPIASGAYAVGSALPTEASLARRFGVSLITVRQALRQLEAEGLIRKRAAKAAVVTEPPTQPRPSSDLKSFADFAANTRDGRLDVRSYREERSVSAAAAFGLAERERCHCLRGVLWVGEEPRTQVTIYFPPQVGSRLAREDFDDVVVFRSVQRRLGIRYAGARVTLRAEAADVTLARDLGYVEGGPVLVMELLYRSVDGQPVELTIAKYRADRSSISYDLPNEAA